MARSRSMPHPAAVLVLGAVFALAALIVLLAAVPLATLLYLARRLQRPARAGPAGRVLEGEFQVLEHSRERLDPQALDDLSLR